MTDVSDFIDVSDPAALEDAVARAREVLADRGCVVLPTDTVYGIGADAFSPLAVAVLVAAKGRSRTMPPPVLIADRRVMAGLAYDVPEEAEALAGRFWPGALTLILKSQPTLTWDLGETRGTVALRVPDDAVARELLYAVGPMAVSSANRTGMDAATTADAARSMLGESVALYLDAGPRESRDPSTIVDCTVTPFRVARQGSVPLEELRAVVPDLLAEGEEPPVAAERIAAFKEELDDYSAILLESLADRLAEAFAERMHQRVRTELWGAEPDEDLDNDALIAERYHGIRPAPGYPACPDHTEKQTLWELLDAEANTGIELTESMAMLPGASVSGWYLAHPESQYFVVGRLGRDQVEEYAARKGWTLAEAEQWLSPNLGYEPED